MGAKLASERVAGEEGLDPAAKRLQDLVQRAFDSSPRLRPLEDALHGVWLGHPLHAAVTDLPAGGWTVTVALDLLSLMSGKPGMRRAADVALALGLAGALAAVPSGLADWSRFTAPAPRRTGLIHGLLNSSATALYAVSLALRLRRRRAAGLVSAGAGYACMLAGAYLGGDLAYREGVGVNRNAWAGGPDRFVRLLRASELREGLPVRAEADGASVLLVRANGRVHAIGETCAHMGGPLAQGSLENGAVTCPWHGSQFRLEDGSVERGPATAPQPRFEVRELEGWIEARRSR